MNMVWSGSARRDPARAEWIPKLGFDFDGSFSDTDIFEPQPGGTCSIFPFFLDSIVGLPYTLPQDHTLISAGAGIAAHLDS